MMKGAPLADVVSLPVDVVSIDSVVMDMDVEAEAEFDAVAVETPVTSDVSDAASSPEHAPCVRRVRTKSLLRIARAYQTR